MTKTAENPFGTAHAYKIPRQKPRRGACRNVAALSSFAARGIASVV